MRTNNLLATGGMMQEGGTVDPVSGNDVPTGSLKEEVRDDIPAQLSPGEFVFPADVTRYIGLDKLMQIREAAKEGLKEMESKGQMGNAEEVADDAVDEDKFSTNIDEIIAGLDGGDDNESQGFAEGGVVKADPAYKDAPIKGFKMVQYEDTETKAVKYIPFINGKALLPIPKGYVEKKAAAPATPPTTPPVVEQPVSPVGGGNGGGGGRGGKSETDGEGDGVRATVNDAGIEGFGDIEGGTSRNVARMVGAGVGLLNPIAGLLVSVAGQYATKLNNEKKAEVNVKAIDASALAAAGFDARDIKSAQEAAAKATIEGKSAKDIAVAAANAASLGTGPGTAKTSLDALIGITNGWNTANKEVMSMPKELADKIPESLFSKVMTEVSLGVPPEKAVQKAVDSVEGKISLAGLDGQVPAGEFDKVAGYINAGFTPREAIDKVVTDSADADIEKQDRAEKADREARDRIAEREAKDQAAEREAKAARDVETDRREAAEAKDRASTAAERAAAEKAERDAQTKQDAAADRESQNGGPGGGGNWGAGGNWGGNSLSRDTGGESGGAG